MKKCPYCGEKISNSAKKCRFCGERLNKDEHQLSISVEEKELKRLNEKQRKFLKDFSWGGFFLPTIMLFHTKQYGRAILCLLLNLAGGVLGLVPRYLVGRHARMKMYMEYEYETFEDFERKTKELEKTFTILGLVLIAVVIMLFTL